MALELNDAMNPHKFKERFEGIRQQYVEAVGEIVEFRQEYGVPLEDADLSPDDQERLEKLEERSAFLEDTLEYWNHDAREHGYNLLS